MDVKTILTIVGTCIGIIAYIIVTACAIKRKKANGETISLETVFQEIAEQAMGFISTAEVAYNALTGATGVKAGAFKLDNVLNKIRDLCNEKGVAYDKSYWTDYISKAVELMNINKSKAETKTPAQTASAPAESYTTTTNI